MVHRTDRRIADGRVLFVCRGSVAEGLGHVMRTRSVAAAMNETSAVTKVVAIGDESLMGVLLAGRALDHVTVATDEEAFGVIRAFAPDVVAFDVLRYELDIFEQIGRMATTVSLSPVFDRLADVDIVYHRTSVLGDDWPDGDEGPRIVRGLEYAVIGENCVRIEEQSFARNLRGDRLSVAVSMGGTDSVNKTLQVINVLRGIPAGLLVWVLLGEGYAHSYQDLVDSIRGSRHEIILAKTSDSMWRIMNQASVAVLASGVTVYEAVFAGLPAISMLENERGRFLIEELVREGACLCAGGTWSESLDALGDVVADLDRDRHRLLTMHRECKRLIDGRGAQRIVTDIRAASVRAREGEARHV